MNMYFCMDVRMHVRFFFDAQKWNGILNIPKKSLRSTFETLKSLIRSVKLKIHSYTRRSIYMCDVSNETLPQHTDQESDPHIYHTLRHPRMLNFTGKLAILLSKKNSINGKAPSTSRSTQEIRPCHSTPTKNPSYIFIISSNILVWSTLQGSFPYYWAK